MHPHTSGEVARLRAQDIAREAAAHHAHHRHPVRVDPAGFLLSRRPRIVATVGRLVVGARHRVGVALIRVGMRIADPARQLNRTPSAR